MSSDISRQRFQPKDNFNAVLMQQGRVLLDADCNEWMEILDRRWRAETVDLVGPTVAPRNLADQGFEISLSMFHFLQFFRKTLIGITPQFFQRTKYNGVMTVNSFINGMKIFG